MCHIWKQNQFKNDHINKIWKRKLIKKSLKRARKLVSMIQSNFIFSYIGQK